MAVRLTMKREGPAALLWLAAGLFATGFFATQATFAAERLIVPGEAVLQQAVSSARSNDVLRLQAGVYRGPLIIDRPLTLLGQDGTVIKGGGSGSIITVSAPRVVLRGLTLQDSGTDLASEDSAIFVDKEGNQVLIEDNRLEGNLIGVYLKGPENAIVRHNTIIGRQDLRVNERGNGVHLWNTPGSIVEENDIRYGRDGIFVTTSHRNIFRNNRFSDLRFAVHYMYTDDSEISGNVSTRNHIGYAIMSSHRLKVRGNISDGDRDHGILLNYANGSRIYGNQVRGGTGKCVFIYNANKNRFQLNRFEGCDIGIHFTAGSQRNEITENAFMGNRTQVKYVGTRQLEWSLEGRGNYWSDNSGFDLDGDGRADQPYRPNDLVDQVVWRHPMAKLLLNSPALKVLQWAQSAFPAIYPGGVTDSAPLMDAPRIDLPAED
jgi:nitrous oxidase accessory protein